MLGSILVAALLCAAPPADARLQTLRKDATAAYKAKKYDKACALFAEATKVAPTDARLAADLGLCLYKLGRQDAAIAETRRAIRLAAPGTEKDDSGLRENAHFNLGLMDVMLPVPEDGKCAPLPAPPGCDRPLHACAYGFSCYGSGGGSSSRLLAVARTPEGAKVEEAEGEQLPYGSYGSLDGAATRADRALLYLSEVEEMFVGKCYALAERACEEDKATQAKATACVKAKGCTADPWTCEDWAACLDASCPEAVQKRIADAEAACRAQSDATTDMGCQVVTADACTGVVATVCTDNKAKKAKRVVHEVVLEPPSGP